MKKTDKWIGESALFAKRHNPSEKTWLVIGFCSLALFVGSTIGAASKYCGHNLPSRYQTLWAIPKILWNGYVVMERALWVSFKGTMRAGLHALPYVGMLAGFVLSVIALAWIVIGIDKYVWMPATNRVQRDMRQVKEAKSK